VAIRSGVHRHRVFIQKPVRSNTTFGSTTIEYILKFLAWAGIQPLAGLERFEAQQVKSETSHRVHVRHRFVSTNVEQDDQIIYHSSAPEIEAYLEADKEEDKRILFGSKTLEIQSILNIDERDRVLQLFCKEMV